MTPSQQRDYLAESIAAYAKATAAQDVTLINLAAGEVQKRLMEVVPDKPTLETAIHPQPASTPLPGSSKPF